MRVRLRAARQALALSACVSVRQVSVRQVSVSQDGARALRHEPRRALLTDKVESHEPRRALRLPSCLTLTLVALYLIGSVGLGDFLEGAPRVKALHQAAKGEEHRIVIRRHRPESPVGARADMLQPVMHLCGFPRRVGVLASTHRATRQARARIVGLVARQARGRMERNASPVFSPRHDMM